MLVQASSKQISMLVRHQISKLEVQREKIREQISKLEAEISSLRMLCTSQARGEGVIAGGVSRGKVGQVAQHLAASATTEWPNLACKRVRSSQSRHHLLKVII